ncbi:hypothetical protein TSA6c_17290 [Azospirillum sp. TSA6c]|nr:hypothetical protein TSA6c_17290 [Azospirillum sp. TSA6c]
MTDSSGSAHSEHVVQSPFGKSMTLHLLRMLEADLQAVDSPAGELDAVQCMGLVLSSVGCIPNEACLDMNELVKERRKVGAAAEDLIDAVLLFRPAGWGYCTWNDTLGGRGYCGHIYPPAIPRRDSEVPSVIGAFSELMAMARAIVKAWIHIAGKLP